MKNFIVSLLLVALSTSSHADYFGEQLELAKQGDAGAQNNLALMYEYGLNVPKNAKTAVMWYTKAAEQGNADAQNNLGLMYAFGEGIQKNTKTAVMWYTKAAEQGNTEAQTNLGNMYGNGEGVPESYIKAYVWASMAKANGNEMAKGNIDIYKGKMTKEQIAKAQELAAKCYELDYKDCN